MNAQAVHDYFKALQERIVAGLEALDGKTFRADAWQRPEGGGGLTRILEEGGVFERGGVNLSRVQGKQLPPSASAGRPQLAGRPYDAMGVSLVLHPRNPYCPTVHLNTRFFCTTDEQPAWWFGGGMDLTPYYGFEEDARHFHAACRKAVGEHYPHFKHWCDQYFHLKHRGEPRGIGGIFFDDLAEGGFESCFGLARSVGEHFLEAYVPIVERRKGMPTFVYMTRCDGCGHCVDICPSDIMHIDKTYRRAYNIEPNMCWECYSCVKACPQNAIDARGYADFAPLGHSVRVLREEAKGTISWRLKFRDGREKNFVSPIRTTPWGSIKGPAEYAAPRPENFARQELAHEPEALKVPGGLPALRRDQLKQGVI